MLLCPVCNAPLERVDNSYKCQSSHSFDISKEGYVNLLTSSKAGDKTGDNKDMAKNRCKVLSAGYYELLACGLVEKIKSLYTNGELLDICCGEGYYSAFAAEKLPGINVYGFDLSKEMIRLAAKRKSRAQFFVANMKKIPFADESFDVVLHLFAPFNSAEFARVLKKDGMLISVVSGERHLFGLKEVLYDNPYINDEAPPDAPEFVLSEKIKLCGKISIDSAEDILSLLKMTPYYYHTPSSGLERIEKYSSLETETEFVLFVYRKK
ncbi:MAG: methyltransferase domain-containing protein [Clostridia bacterium]|nr:methyltransferase domain-containing protein [Clostridia bacterium]